MSSSAIAQMHQDASSGKADALKTHLQNGVDLWTFHEGLHIIHTAAISNQADCLVVLLDHGVPIDIEDSKGRSPLVAAAENASFDAIRVLVSYGCNVYTRSEDGKSVPQILKLRIDSLTGDKKESVQECIDTVNVRQYLLSPF
eukprot:TRINITY_DN3755_c0_g1_i2.p1 TRINITY_DN3755_c0_g1~~TRINITY_DN3755_c0_g1_i2.p1  ORF type:complete len:162 (-),score=2.73 TRINITY_DN3755_c0_g1_i2:321-749(-)